ncbi:unnamed protein product [Sphagnum jensenii]|uniref:Protein kinase domain-containing protein n=1 Tax=Sphagnum jensenii TaxID=128206 RepID=A0ABP1AR55_9BRYO
MIVTMPPPGAASLLAAAKEGDLDTVQKVLQQQPPIDVNEANEKTHFTALHEAARAGQILVVQSLLKQPGINVNLHVYKTALCAAAQSGHVAIVKLLLGLPEIDVNAGYGGTHSADYWVALTYSPLHAATSWNRVEIVKLLLEHPKIDVNAKKSFRELTPLHVALWKPAGNYSRPFKSNRVSRSRFHAESRREVVLALLAHKDLNANLENCSRNTPLHYMVFFDVEISLVELLLRRPEVDVNARGEGTMTPLHHAASKGNLAMIRVFLKHPRIIVDFPDMHRSTPLFAAAEKGMAEAAELLLQKGADIHATSSKVSRTASKGTYRNTPLYCAAEGGHKQVVELLLKQPGIESELAPANKNWSTPLHAAAFWGHNHVVKLLLESPEVQASLAATGSRVKTTTALHLACKHGYRETVSSLLSCKQVRVNVEDNKSLTPLHLAVQKGHTKIVRLLLENGADVDCKSIHMAARFGNEAGLTIASLLAEKNREALLQQVEAEKDPSLREFLEKVRLAEDPMGQFTVALKHLKEEGRNCVVFAEHSPSKSPVVIKYYQHEGDRQHNIDLLQDLKKGGIELKHVTSLFTYESTPYFTWETRNQMCPYALVLASEAGAGTEPRTLRNLMDRGVLRHQHNAKRQVFELVAGAVLELHRADIAHGDLKPENLLVYSIHGHLECKVIDLDNTRRKNTEWRRGGTIVYYSPELAEEHRLPDHAGQVQATLEGDRWAIGAILYELVTGQKLVCTLLEKAEGENYEASDADKALEKLVGVKQEVLDDLCNMIRDGGSDYYKQAGELLQKVLKKDKIWRWSIDKMLESSFVKGGATVTSKLPLMDLVKNVNNCSDKLSEATKAIKELHGHISAQWQDLGEHLKGLPLELPDKLVEKVISRMDGLSNLIKNVGLCPHPHCFIVLPSNLDDKELMDMNENTREEKLLDIQNFLEDVAKSVENGKPDSLLAYIGNKIGNRFHKTVYIALVCEECWKPQLPPYRVRVKKDEASKLVQALKISVRLCQLVNLAAGIVNCLYPMVPQRLAPDQLINYLDRIRAIHDNGSDVVHFPPINNAIGSSYGDTRKLSDADAR